MTYHARTSVDGTLYDFTPNTRLTYGNLIQNFEYHLRHLFVGAC